jgi:hypothetical protein
MFRFLIAAAVVLGLTFTSVASAQVKAAAVAVEQSEGIVKVVKIDQQARTALVSTADGATFTVNVPPEAQNLDRVKTGDLFKLRYVQSVVLALNKGGAAEASELRSVEVAPKGGTPGGKVVNTKNLTVTVQAIDKASRTLTVQGPAQRLAGLKVSDDVRSFDEIAVGDTITLTYIEALALEMVPQASATGATY